MVDGWEQLDSVRLILAVIVAVAHALGIFVLPFWTIPQWIGDASTYSTVSAVLLFFLISGLVIGRSLRSLAKKTDYPFPIFMWRRFTRIYPPLLFSVLVCVVFALILQFLGMDSYSGPATDLTRDSFSYLDSLPGVILSLETFGFRGGLTGVSNGPLWSLQLEMQAYVFAGLIAQAIVAKTTPVRIVSIALLAMVAKLRGAQDLQLYHWICFTLFAAGMALSTLPIRFPRLIPVVSVDCSYSLYILHFPTILLIFFLTCSGKPPGAIKVSFLIVLSFAAVAALSIFSGVFVERTLRRRRELDAPAEHHKNDLLLPQATQSSKS
jgi:peptidoglycan/LPS O-acetylase OafA/YrhL